MTLALSHGAETIYSSSVPSTRVLVGTIDGVAELQYDGDSWAIVRRTLPGEHIHAILLEEETGTWFAGVSKGGIYRSTDDAGTWEPCNAGLVSTNLYSLACTKVNGRPRLFAGTEPVHLHFSDDLGDHWVEMPGMQNVPNVDAWRFPGPPYIGHLKHITFAPGNGSIIYASVEQGGLYVSRDAGRTFDEISGPIDDVHRLVISPTHPEFMYTTGGGGLSMSEDAGCTWNNIFGYESAPGGYPDQLVFKPSDPDYMLVAAGQKSPRHWRAESNTFSRISRSRDAGRTWEVLTHGLPKYMKHSIEAMALEEAGTTTQVFAASTGGDVIWSSDGGDTWQKIISDLSPVSKGDHYLGITASAISVS